MGLFSEISGFIKNPVKKVTKIANKVIKNPVRGLTAVSTLGLSEVARNLPVVGNIVKQGQEIASGIYTTGANVVTGGAFSQIQNVANQLTMTKEPDMGINLGGILGSVGTIFGGNQNPVFQGISNVANLATAFLPNTTGSPPGAMTTAVARPVMAAVPMTRVMAMVGRRFFDKFPNLATAIQGYRNMGKNITRAKLHSLLKRFGPELLISGGILTAAAVSELMMAGPGTRRMNPGNVKALRRSARRLESFHKLCVRVGRLRKPRARTKTVSVCK